MLHKIGCFLDFPIAPVRFWVFSDRPTVSPSAKRISAPTSQGGCEGGMKPGKKNLQCVYGRGCGWVWPRNKVQQSWVSSIQ